MISRSRPRLAAMAVLVALITAACGGASETTEPADEPETATVAAPTATSAPTPTPTVESTSRPTATPDSEPTAQVSPTPEPTPTPGAPQLITVVLHDGEYPSYGADKVTVPVFGTPAIDIAADGRPRVVHLSGPSTIDLSICADPTCAVVDTTAFVDIAPAGRIFYRAVGFDGDGRPMVLYEGTDNPGLGRESDTFSVASWCVDVACEAVESHELARGGAPVRELAGAVFATSPDGRRFVTTWGLAGGGVLDIRLSDCTEPRCAPGPGDVVHTPTDRLFEQRLAFRATGEPVIAFVTQRASAPGSPYVRTLHLLGCDDAACASTTGPLPLLESEPGGFLSPEPPLVTDDRVAVVARSGVERSAQVVVITCDDVTCAEPDVTVPITAVGEGLAAALGSDGLPRIAWTDTMGEVNYSRCLDPTCAGVETTRLAASAEHLTLAVTDDTAYVATGPFPAHLLVCPADLCE